MFTKPESNEFTEAAADLACEQRSKQFPDNLTADDARDYVDAKLIACWAGMENAGRDFEIIMGDLCAQRLNGEQAKTIICALALGHYEAAGKLLQAALVEQVSRDLAYAAQRLVDDYEPTDSEMARLSYASWVADPVADDRRALAKLAR